MHLDSFAARLEQYRYSPTRFMTEILGLEPHEGQRKWLTRSTNPENGLVCGNRWGKSQVAAAKVIWKCVYRKGWDDGISAAMRRKNEPYFAINISITADQAKLVWLKAQSMLLTDTASWLVKDVKFTPFPRMELANGALFEARSSARRGERLLGASWDHVNFDEAALEPHFLALLDNVLRMRVLDRRGTIDFTSTGQGRNPFGRYILAGMAGKEPDLYTQSGSSLENPYLPRDWIESTGRRMTERMRRQNIQGEIVDAGGGYFDVVDLEAAISDELTQSMVVHARNAEDAIERAEVYADRDVESGEVGIPYHARYPSHRYVHFWDLADKKDWVVGRTIDTTSEPMKAIEFERFNQRGWSYTFDRIRERHHRYGIGHLGSDGYGQSKTYVDSTGVGDVAVDNLKDIGAEGFQFTKASKDEILTGLQSVLSLREISMPLIPVEYDELKFYEREDKSIVQDCVMALAGAVHFSRRRPYVYAAEV